jgi:predicted DNA-binding transcriptional regulator YafY
MFKEQEIEALVLGARIVESWADPELAAAASDVIAKVQAVVPDRLREYMANTALLAPPHHWMEPIAFDMAELRRALRSQLKVRFAYRDAQAEASERTVRPLCLAYYGPVWMLSAWCELREDFRTFRLDRMADFAVPGERFRQEPGKTLHDFLKRDQTWTRSRAAPNGWDGQEQDGACRSRRTGNGAGQGREAGEVDGGCAPIQNAGFRSTSRRAVR